MILRTLLLAICGLSLFSVEASALPVLWQLVDVQFSDGGTATGRFVYEIDLNKYFATLITTTAGSARSGATYVFASPTSDRFHALFLTGSYEDQKGRPALELFYTEPLTDQGGNVSLVPRFGIEFTCGNAACTTFATPQRLVTSGYLHGTPPYPLSSTSSFGGNFRSPGSVVAAALLGEFSLQSQAPASQRPLPAASQPRVVLEGCLPPAMSDSRELRVG